MPDGIAYLARHDDTEVCYAIFGRDKQCVEAISVERDLNKNEFFELCSHYGVGLAPEE